MIIIHRHLKGHPRRFLETEFPSALEAKGFFTELLSVDPRVLAKRIILIKQADGQTMSPARLNQLVEDEDVEREAQKLALEDGYSTANKVVQSEPGYELKRAC